MKQQAVPDVRKKDDSKGVGEEEEEDEEVARGIGGGESAPIFRSISLCEPPQASFLATNHAWHDDKKPAAVVKASSLDSSRCDRIHVPDTNRHHHHHVIVVAGWQKPMLTRLSRYHTLEAYHRVLAWNNNHNDNNNNNTKALESLLERLCRIMKQQSLHATYQDCPVVAYCTSLDQVSLVVSLYLSRDSQQKLVVQVQRRAGDAYLFGRYARNILAAIDNNDGTTLSEKEGAGAPAVSASVCGMPILCERFLEHAMSLEQAAAMQQQQANPAVTALELAHNMIMTDRYDAQQLGLESLCILTDPSKTGTSVAVTASHAVLLGQSQSQSSSFANNNDVICRRIQERVLTLALSKNGIDNNNNNDDDGSTDDGDATMKDVDEEYQKPLAYLALVAVANAMQVLSQYCNREAVNEQVLTACLAKVHDDLTLEELIQSLSYKIQAACPDQPHVAYFSTLALLGLCEMVPSVRHQISPLVIEEAQQVGLSGHAALETASERLLEEIKV